MRKFLFFFLTILLLISCQQPNENNTIEKVTKNNTTISKLNGLKAIQVFPLENNNSVIQRSIMRSPIHEKKQKDLDFEDGIMYNENAYPNDSIIHTLDVSSIIGNNKAAQVFFVVEWVDGAQDEVFSVFFKPYGINCAYQSTGVGYGQRVILVNTITDSQGRIQWYHNHTLPFDGRNENSEPGYHDYNAIKIRIIMYYYDNTGEIIE